MRAPTERSNLRKRAQTAYREYRTLMILAGWLTAQDRSRIEQSLEDVVHLPRARLTTELERIRREGAKLRQTLGARVKTEEYERLLRQATRVDKLLFVPKWIIEQVYFNHYERAFPVFRQLPAHARIGIDVHGILKPKTLQGNWRLLEATLFEDMALLWNHVLDAAEIKLRQNTKESTKWLDSLLRATTRAAFHLLEGYLNGIAFNIVVTERSLSDDDDEKLREWDIKRGRPRPLSLRDKLLQYPRIAVHAAHPPLSESNCTEMRLVVEKEEAVRHALVHPTPRYEKWRSDKHAAPRLTPRDASRLEEAREADFRESVFFTQTIDSVAEIVDSVIRLIRTTSHTVGEGFGNVDLWLFERDEAGRFPVTAFE